MALVFGSVQTVEDDDLIVSTASESAETRASIKNALKPGTALTVEYTGGIKGRKSVLQRLAWACKALNEEAAETRYISGLDAAGRPTVQYLKKPRALKAE